MKLSEFDLDWYAQWGITHEPLEEWSRPGLTNGLGSVQIPADPTSLRHVVFAPISSAEESTGYLTLNGVFLTATRTPTTLRWTPWAVERECRYDNWSIHCKTSMAPERPGLVQRITLTNQSGEARPLDLGFRLSGRCVNRGPEPWFWGIPKVELSVDALHGHSGLNPNKCPIDINGQLFQERQVDSAEPGTPMAFAGQACNAQVLSPAPDHWLPTETRSIAEQSNRAKAFLSTSPSPLSEPPPQARPRKPYSQMCRPYFPQPKISGAGYGAVPSPRRARCADNCRISMCPKPLLPSL